jgi:hypothetical protein
MRTVSFPGLSPHYGLLVVAFVSNNLPNRHPTASSAGIQSPYNNDGLKSALFSVAAGAKMREALYAFHDAWDEINRNCNASVELQRAYITENPRSDLRSELNRAAGPLKYHEIHELYHPYFRQLVADEGYYDLFLFSLEGDCVYTVAKELDFASNLLNGRWASSGLGSVLRAALAEPRAVHEVGFAPYAPSNGDLASFIATGILDKGRLLGIIALQVPFAAAVQLAPDGDRIQSCVPFGPCVRARCCAAISINGATAGTKLRIISMTTGN